MPPPDVPLLISTSVSPAMRAVTFVNTPLPGAIVTVSANAMPATAAIAATNIALLISLRSFFSARTAFATRRKYPLLRTKDEGQMTKDRGSILCPPSSVLCPFRTWRYHIIFQPSPAS